MAPQFTYLCVCITHPYSITDIIKEKKGGKKEERERETEEEEMAKFPTTPNGERRPGTDYVYTFDAFDVVCLRARQLCYEVHFNFNAQIMAGAGG